MIFTSQRPEWTCARCGKCCIEKPCKDRWRVSPSADKITDDMKINKGEGCEMLGFEDGLAFCNIQRIFGYEAKPKNCREFPVSKSDFEFCERE